jgi:hypothetical protein
MDQIEEYNPPPNPAKITDSRYEGYTALYGEYSWELDALEPQVLIDLVQHHVDGLINETKWKAAMKEEESQREILLTCVEQWPSVVDFLENRED